MTPKASQSLLKAVHLEACCHTDNLLMEAIELNRHATWPKQQKHFASHHPSKPFVCWKRSNCTNSMCCPLHKVSKIKDTGGEIRYLPTPTFNSAKPHPALDTVLPFPILSESAQNRVKLSNTTRKMNFGSVCPWVRHRWPYSLSHRLEGLKRWSYNGLSRSSQH